MNEIQENLFARYPLFSILDARQQKRLEGLSHHQVLSYRSVDHALWIRLALPIPG